MFLIGLFFLLFLELLYIWYLRSVLWISEFDNIQWLQNIFIGNGAVFGLWLAYKRSDALQKQAEAANRQAEVASQQAQAASQQAQTASQQAEIAGKRYASEQFSSGVELLAKDNQKGNPAIGARVGGIYALEKLASADPKQYGAQVMKTLVAYIRDNAQRTALPVAAGKMKKNRPPLRNAKKLLIWVRISKPRSPH